MKYDHLLHPLRLIIINNQLFVKRERDREREREIYFDLVLGLGIRK